MLFYLEYELRARHPKGVIARLSPYTSYYWSPEHKDDQPPFPTTLFVVDNEDIEDTYVRTAARMTRMSLPILVSCIPVLSTTGILGRSWRPLWEPESPRLTLSDLLADGWGMQNAPTGAISEVWRHPNRPVLAMKRVDTSPARSGPAHAGIWESTLKSRAMTIALLQPHDEG